MRADICTEQKASLLERIAAFLVFIYMSKRDVIHETS